MSADKILVTGATGQLGSLIVRHLVSRVSAARVIAGGRNSAKAPAGVEFRTVDYDQPASIEAALAGVSRVVLVSGNEVGKRVPQHRAVIEAAGRTGVRLLAYTSILRAEVNPMQLAGEHRGTEQVLAKSKVPHILLRNGWYNENFANGAAPAIQYGLLRSASGHGRISSASRNDFAEGAAALILRDNHRNGHAYELAGTTSFTKSDFAALLTRKSGKNIVLEDMTEAQYAAALVQVGLPEPFAKILADSDARAGDGWLYDDSRTLESAIGRPTATLSETLDKALQS